MSADTFWMKKYKTLNYKPERDWIKIEDTEPIYRDGFNIVKITKIRFKFFVREKKQLKTVCPWVGLLHLLTNEKNWLRAKNTKKYLENYLNVTVMFAFCF